MIFALLHQTVNSRRGLQHETSCFARIRLPHADAEITQAVLTGAALKFILRYHSVFIDAA